MSVHMPKKVKKVTTAAYEQYIYKNVTIDYINGTPVVIGKNGKIVTPKKNEVKK